MVQLILARTFLRNDGVCGIFYRFTLCDLGRIGAFDLLCVAHNTVRVAFEHAFVPEWSFETGNLRILLAWILAALKNKLAKHLNITLMHTSHFLDNNALPRCPIQRRFRWGFAA